MEITTLGALLGLAVAIFLIVKKVQPTYSLILGALIGGLVGGAGLTGTVSTMITGAEGMMSSVLRILTSGILAGILIQTGAAAKIAEVIVSKLGEKKALAAIAIATMVLCAVGVFIDISVITVAPIALAIGEKAGYNKASVLLAMIGGGKAGNFISPNPTTIAVAENFNLDLSSVMAANIVPALCALVVTIILATVVSKKKGSAISKEDLSDNDNDKLPSFFASIIGPVVVIVLLSLRPLTGIVIDPLIALPIGGFVTLICTGHIKSARDFTAFGLTKVTGVAVLLIGTGTIAGIIKTSNLQADVINLLEVLNMPTFILAPIAGILMAAATASATAGATIASSTFSTAILDAGIPALSGAAMVHAGATVLDSLPHGSFFHATGGVAHVSIPERMKLIPYEALIGLTTTVVSIIIYLI